jgi:hypothetical protein
MSFNHFQTVQLMLGKSILILSFCVFMVGAATANSLQQTIDERLANLKLKQTILGALIYLNDRQIKVRKGKRLSDFDACENDGCKTIVPWPLQVLGIDKAVINDVGEWANYIFALPDLSALKQEPPKLSPSGAFKIQDSNVFTTASIAYPFYLYNEQVNSGAVIKPMQDLAVASVAKYKRQDSYAFYPQVNDGSDKAEFIHAVNLSDKFVQNFLSLYTNPDLSIVWQYFARKGVELPSQDWLEEVISNPYGLSMAYNVPNDVDDTSVVVALQQLHANQYANVDVDLEALQTFPDYRDLHRVKSFPGENWKPDNSGAYLTWQKNENTPTFESPEMGVIPYGINDVDCVVNANAIFALTLTGQTQIEGYQEAVDLVSHAIETQSWEACGTYYPQRQMFPYTVTRAWRDTGLSDDRLNQAMGKLLTDLLADQAQLATDNPDLEGAFPGGVDNSFDLSTALGVVSLLNIGRDIAQKAGQLTAYENSIEKGIAYLLRKAQVSRVMNPETLSEWRHGVYDISAKHWHDGLFFSYTFTNYPQWRSANYTTGIALEALSKYLMAYEYGDVNMLSGRRIYIEGYTRVLSQTEKAFLIDIALPN